MIGIYQDSFIELIKNTLGDPVKVTHKQIICRCPWCEYNVEKDHYHLWISLEAPIFNCFHCPDEEGHKGIISKFIKKLHGTDVSDTYVDRSKIKEYVETKVKLGRQITKKINLSVPEINTNMFNYKLSYLKKRFKYADINISNIKGLVCDVEQFIHTNNIQLTDTLTRLLPFLQSNFIGFITENHSMMILRNVDPTSSFRYYKLKIEENPIFDYYKINGLNPISKNVILAEGIFDVFSEYIFDYLNMKKDILLYATANSKKYQALLRSISFYEQIFRIKLHILSDRGITIEDYKKMLYFNSHFIESLTIYYNKLGKDFNDTPCQIETIVLK